MSILLMRGYKKPQRKRRRRAARSRKVRTNPTSTSIGGVQNYGGGRGALGDLTLEDEYIAAEEAQIAAEEAEIATEERQLKAEEEEYEALKKKAKIIDVCSIILGLLLLAIGGALAYLGFGPEERDDKVYRIGGPALLGIGAVFMLLGLMSRITTIETPEVDQENAGE